MLQRLRTAFQRSRSTAILAAGVALPVSLSAQQTPSPALSLEQAVRMARENNPLFLQQKNDVDVARSAVRAAYGNLLPSASVQNSYGYTASGERRFGSVEFGQQPDYYSSDYYLGVGYELSGSALLQPSVERSQRRATERRVVGFGANLDAEVAQQYLSVLQAREQIQQTEKQLSRAKEHVRLAQARLEVGAGTPLDVRRAEVQLGRAEVALLQARNTAATAAITLGQLVGVPLDPEVGLTSRFAIFEPTWRAEQLVQSALQGNPTLLAAEASAEAARTSVRSARTRYLPSLNFNMGWRGSVYQAGNIDPLVQGDLFQAGQRFQGCQQSNALARLLNQPAQDCGMFDIRNPAVEAGIRSARQEQNSGFPFSYSRQPMTAAISISLPIFQGFTRQLQVDQARAQASDARQQVRAEELRLRQEVSAGVRNLETAHQTALLQEKVRKNAEEELRLAQERFRFGAANSIEVTDAQANLAQAERDEINAVYDFHKTLATLEALVGRSLR